jgi:hypothetical protein
MLYILLDCDLQYHGHAVDRRQFGDIVAIEEEENQLTTGESLANKLCTGSRDLQLPIGEAWNEKEGRKTPTFT